MTKRAPYLPFRTFSTFLDDLRVSGLPIRIDKAVLADRSRSMQSQILSSLHYLGLTDAAGSPTQDLSLLVRTEGREREEVWEGILRKSYSSLFELSIEDATTEDFLNELLKEGMHSQDTLRKALNFFSLATRAAGLRISPRIKPYAGRRQSALEDSVSRKDRFKVVSLPLPRRVVTTANESKNLEIVLSKFPEFNPSWPQNERQNWLAGFRDILRFLNDEDKRESEESNERTA